MAFFKSRSKNPAAEDAAPDEAQSMDSLRQQARHRLIGATVLVVIAVVGFPLVFDTKPRDVASDIRIDMPERESVRASQPPSIPVPDKQALVSPPAEEVVAGTDKITADNAAAPDKVTPVVVDSKTPAVKLTDSKPADAKSADSEKAKPGPVADKAADTKSSDKAEPAAPAAERFIVQVGAYSDESKVKEVRAKLEKAGYSTYVHVAQTKEGKRTRVRIGPFATKQEAQKIVGKIKSLNFNASVLTL
jgi:DedD protein